MLLQPNWHRRLIQNQNLGGSSPLRGISGDPLPLRVNAAALQGKNLLLAICKSTRVKRGRAISCSKCAPCEQFEVDLLSLKWRPYRVWATGYELSFKRKTLRFAVSSIDEVAFLTMQSRQTKRDKSFSWMRGIKVQILSVAFILQKVRYSPLGYLV